ncbi:hypothetical protein PybrP1_011943 [[Pythium] brassicae (nom. inval.)]|nr:hypothetical protein PybrP1_011943 [[Pythium] brassicae (nom. inval.)]
MRALVDELRSESIRHAIQTASDGSLTHLLIQPADTVELTKEFQDVVYMDSTYRTNRYSMPLLHVVGQTNTGKSFTIALCFMRTEKSADYLWALQQLKLLTGGDFQPGVVVTDRELALVNTLAQVYPATSHILSAWHIAKNILAKCKAEFPAVGDERSMSWDEFNLE